MQSRNDPSFLFVKRKGAPYGEMLGRINPFSNNSSICAFNSFSSAGAIRYGVIEIGVVPDTKSILNTMLQIGSKTGKSSEN